MSTGLYSHTTRAVGTILTAAIYNADHQNHITNQNPAQSGGLADTLAEYRSMTDPGGVGSEVLSTNLAGELQRLRFAINRILGKSTQWYDTPTHTLEELASFQDPGGVLTKTANYTVVAPTDNGRTILVTTAGVVISTPPAATAHEGFSFWVNNQSTGNVTVDGNASETIDGALTITIPKGRGVFIQTNGLIWATGGQDWPENILVRNVPMFPPPGRLSLASGIPVHSADITGQTTVFWSPYGAAAIQLFNGTDWTAVAFVETSQNITDATKSPAATVANSVYDLFGWLDGAAFRISRGPPWTSAVARGAGAGTTELLRVNGVLMNAAAITNGPAAQRGIFLGTIATDAANQLNMKMNPAAAAGGGACRLDVWNAYNRVPINATSKDSTDLWVYNTATWRPANNNTNNRISSVFGLAEDMVEVLYSGVARGSNSVPIVGVGLDSTTAWSGRPGASGTVNTGGNFQQMIAQYASTPGLGFHFFQALEYGGGNADWIGDNGAPLNHAAALTFIGRM